MNRNDRPTTFLFLPVSLITVPGGIALVFWALAPVVLLLDARLSVDWPDWLRSDPEAARALVSTVASAAITTLSLVYSIMLVVFTLAAGNIAPRLLRRFSDDRANQVTAGLLGGTFLFSLTILHNIGPDTVPHLGLFASGGLMTISVLQLVYFVHSVSDSVTIDSEIARISDQLRTAMEPLTRPPGPEQERAETGPVDGPTVPAPVTGYVSRIDEDALIRGAAERDIRIELLHFAGEYVLVGQPILRLSRTVGAKTEDALLSAIDLEAARGTYEDMDYTLSLLLEIALRALSPGVNDVYTAIAATDRIAGALVGPVRDGLRSAERHDADGVARLRYADLTLEHLLHRAFDPLREAAARNMLMSRHLAQNLLQLDTVAGDAARPLLRHHARLLRDDATARANASDARDLRRMLTPLVTDAPKDSG